MRGRLAEAERPLSRPSSTARELEALELGYRERVDRHAPAAHRELPRVLPGLFADAARRAREAGFDGVELHYAHAYTMASFLSALNTRDGRLRRLAREPRAAAARGARARCAQRVGADCVVGCRYLGDDVVEGGNASTTRSGSASSFARAGLDFLSLSKGGKFEDAQAAEGRRGGLSVHRRSRATSACRP